LTKAETVLKIAEKTGIQKEQVEKIMEAFFVTIKDSMENGENIYFRGFGSFTNKKRAAKRARNISKIRRSLFRHIQFHILNLRMIL